MPIQIDPVILRGDLVIPADAPGLVLFSGGSGSSHRSQHSRFVAKRLQHSQWATLLIDLLTEEEDRVDANRWDLDLLTARLLGVTRWARQHLLTAALPIGYFGAGTGAALALRAAAELGNEIRAVVCCGGRPDLAATALDRVLTPTLLIVGGRDEQVLDLNRQAYEGLAGSKRLEVVRPCEQREVLARVADLAPNGSSSTFGDRFRVEAQIVLWEGREVLKIPAGALFREGEDWAVFTVEDGKARRRPVEVGHRNPDEAEILSGLKAGDTVIVYPSDAVKDGMRVEPRRAA